MGTLSFPGEAYNYFCWEGFTNSAMQCCAVNYRGGGAYCLSCTLRVRLKIREVLATHATTALCTLKMMTMMKMMMAMMMMMMMEKMMMMMSP